MKKRLFIFIVLAAVLCLALSACGGDKIAKLTDIPRYSTMTSTDTDRIDVEFDNHTGKPFCFTIDDEETICEIMDIVINAEVTAKKGDLMAGDNTYIKIVQGDITYSLSVRANKEDNTFYYFNDSSLQDKIIALATDAGAYEPENPFADCSAFVNDVIGGLKEKGYSAAREFTTQAIITKGAIESNVKADFYDENNTVQDKLNGVCLSCGRYAFSSSDSIYKEVCGALLETLNIVPNGVAEMDNILATYNEEAKISEIFTKNGYTYFLLYHEKGEYSSLIDGWFPNFQFKVFSLDSIENYHDNVDKSQYAELTTNHINQPTIYSSSKVHFEGTVLQVRNIQDTEAYVVGKVVTVQVGEFTCEIWYDYAWYPFDFVVGDNVDVYGTVDTWGDIVHISAKKLP